MKFCIVQHVTPAIDTYAKYSVASIYNYARSYNYDYWIVRERNTRGLFTHYTKIDALKLLLESPEWTSDCDYIVFIDADMVLIEPERQLSWFIHTYGNDQAVIYMPQDVGRESHRLKRPFTCVVFVKNNDEGRAVVNRWMDACLNEGRHHNEAHPYEQGVYWDYVMPQLGQKQVVLPLKYFEFSPIQRLGFFRKRKPFLDHLLRRTTEVRVKMMSKLYEEYIRDEVLLAGVEKLLTGNDSGVIRITEQSKRLKAHKFKFEP